MKTVLRSTLALALALVATANLSAQLQQAVMQARSTGKPMLVTCTSPSCPPCRKLLQDLNTNAELQPLLSQYVVLKISAGSADYSRWTRAFPSKGKGIPKIYIVGSDGTEIVNMTGYPGAGGVKSILEKGIAQNAAGAPAKAGPAADNIAGGDFFDGGVPGVAAPDEDAATPKTVDHSRKLANLLRRVKNFRKHNRTRAAVDSLVVYFKIDEPGQSETVDQLDRIADELTAEAKKVLDDATLKIASPDKAELGVLAVLKVERLYSGLPDIDQQLEKVTSRIEGDDDLASILPRARACDAARVLDEDKEYDAAMDIYRDIAARFPDTVIARCSEIRLKQLANPEVRISGNLVELTKKADYYLRMANRFASQRKEEKAVEYARKVISTLPGSTQASQAQRIIDRGGRL